MSHVDGIDTSNFQGPFNWQAWRGKIGFAMVQATDGTQFTDPDFAHDWKGMEDIGIVRFAYHFAQPGQSSAGFQARKLVQTARNFGLRDHDHFALDLEVTGGLAPHEVATWARRFCRSVNSTGHRCLVYTYPAFAEAGNCAGLDPWHLWLADYDVERPTVPAPWKNWLIWQYTGTDLDRDLFNGDDKALKEFAGVPG